MTKMKMPEFKPLDCMAGSHKPREGESEIVKALAIHGVKDQAIAKYIGMRLATFEKRYKEELEHARMQAKVNVHKFLLKSATGEALDDENGKATYADCVRAAIFYAKAQMGWSETVEHKHTGEIGVVNTLSDDQLVNLIENGGAVVERVE